MERTKPRNSTNNPIIQGSPQGNAASKAPIVTEELFWEKHPFSGKCSPF